MANASMSTNLSSSYAALLVDTRGLAEDCQRLSCDLRADGHRYQWYAQLASLFSGALMLSCFPFAVWQVRDTDRVWRIRNPQTVQRHRWLLYGNAFLSTAILGGVVFAPKWGLRARAEQSSQHSNEVDRIGWDSLRLRQATVAAAYRAESPMLASSNGGANSWTAFLLRLFSFGRNTERESHSLESRTAKRQTNAAEAELVALQERWSALVARRDQIFGSR